jgi:hypothetical protein
MKPVHNYIVIVDAYRARYAVQRPTAGRYRVGAHDECQAEELVKEIIGFGHPVTRCKCAEDDPMNVPYKTVVREVMDYQTGKYRHEPAQHASAPRKKE